MAVAGSILVPRERRDAKAARAFFAKLDNARIVPAPLTILPTRHRATQKIIREINGNRGSQYAILHIDRKWKNKRRAESSTAPH